MYFRTIPEVQGPWSGSQGGWQPPVPCHGISGNGFRPFLFAMPALTRPWQTQKTLYLLDLGEFQLDRRRAAEDRHRDLHARTALVDFLDHAREGRDRAVGDGGVLADLE